MIPPPHSYNLLTPKFHFNTDYVFIIHIPHSCTHFPFSPPVHPYAYLYSRVPPSSLPTSRVSWKNILKRNNKTKNCHSLFPLHGKRKHINNMLFCEVFSLLFYFYIFLWEQEWERRDIFYVKIKKAFRV